MCLNVWKVCTKHLIPILYIISLVCPSVCRGLENCPLEPRTRGPKNNSGPRVLTSVSAQQLPETDVVNAAISKLPLFSFCICNFPITSQSPSSLCFLFVSAAFQSPRNLQAPSAFFLYLQLSNHLAISKLPLLSFCICSFPITSQI